MPGRQRFLSNVRTLAWIGVGGLLGVGLMVYRRRRGERSDMPDRHRIGHATFAAALAVVVAGAGTRTYVAIRGTERCPVTLPRGTVDRIQDRRVVSSAESVATWVPTGIAMGDAYLAGGEICLIRPYRMYVGVHAKYPGLKYVTIGDAFLSRKGLAAAQTPNRVQLAANTAHESRHRAQWAVGTVLGGPLAFPVVYSVADLFFPGARNPFERLAGLKQGNYNPYSSAEPVLRLPQIGTLVLSAVTLELMHHFGRLARRRRRGGQVDRRGAPGLAVVEARIDHRRDTRAVNDCG
ncbi:MAG: hypothetical protein JOZ99_01810 [Actinobacteria bacterium]|nr:hypothetical protein [Actinomycetota bacterium]